MAQRDEMTRRAWKPVLLAAAVTAAVLCPAVAQAYVGPGAGFAVVGSLGVVLIAFFLALGSLITWPFRAIRRAVRGRKYRGKASIRRAIVLGLDGLDPVLAARFMSEGKLPHFKKLAETGSFVPLETACPSMSPVAWSTFATGVDASRHNIFDFLTRDERTYLPLLSSTRITNPDRVLKLGRYRIPLGKPSIRLMRKSRAFWSVLDDAMIPCHVLRVPITFPPETLKNGVMLSAMCVPDLRGSQGSFTYFTTDAEKAGRYTGGELLLVERHGDVIVGELPGPANPFTAAHEDLTVPFVARVDEEDGQVWFDFGGNELTLGLREYSDWLTVTFRPGLGVKIRGIVRLYVNSVKPHFELYVTPINIDPANPAMPISTPGMFAQYLANLDGSYATLGLAEDTWALNERMIDEAAFLEQTYLIHDERERMFLNSLKKNRSGLTAVVFDATDRIQHMLFRYLDERHPSNRGKDTNVHRRAIEDLYVRMDKLLGRVMNDVDEKTLLMVISDHGFKPFRRGVNLNNWFLENGYMAAADGGVGEYLSGVDWSRTKAYQLGLSGVYLNRKGREAKGIVAKDEYRALKQELKRKLEGLKDPETGEIAITSVYDVAEMMDGPYAEDAPDLIIGYNVGYRASWDAAVGKSGPAVIDDNTKSWSGDHCIDYKLVPGVLFCNRKVAAARPRLMDIGPSVLDLFGVGVPEYMRGRSVFSDVGAKGEGAGGGA
jgi:predicted AlkP superfamily phosphohydrolase/phosphomutase